jgi:hypothetical protein
MTKKKNQETAEEWDISEGMGILPDGISLTQNIGCVGGKTSKPEKQDKKEKK